MDASNGLQRFDLEDRRGREIWTHSVQGAINGVMAIRPPDPKQGLIQERVLDSTVLFSVVDATSGSDVFKDDGIQPKKRGEA